MNLKSTNHVNGGRYGITKTHPRKRQAERTLQTA